VENLNKIQPYHGLECLI